MSSWYDAWADRYDERSAGVTADVRFYVEEARAHKAGRYPLVFLPTNSP